MISPISGNFGSIVLGALAFFSAHVDCLTPEQWRSQSIYQVLTDRFARTDGSTTAKCDLAEYCGGTWRGIINHLDYIQNMGFTAIWISPVVDNLQDPTGQDGDSYHGYWAQNIYQVNTNFGSASDLVALSDALHARGMYLMVDVVTNHMAYNGAGNAVDYSKFYPFNKQSYYHDFCLIDNNNATSVEVCWEGDNTVALPDLRTEDANVVAMWQKWVKQLVSNYTIDGLRIDSAIEVDQAFFPPFGQASGIYNMGEVYNGNEWQFCDYQNYIDGAVNYPAFFWVTQAFESTTGSMSTLAQGLEIMIGQCKDTTLLGSFLENHDQPRFPSLTSDMALTQNAIGFTMLADGMPIIYQGQEQHFSGHSNPQNRENLWSSGYSTTSTLYSYITTLNQVRSHAISQDTGYLTYNNYPVYSDSNNIVMRKGSTGSQVLSVFTNKGASGSGSFTLTSSASGLTSGQSVTELLSCTTYNTDSSGNLAITVTNGAPQIFYPSSKVSGSGLCKTTKAGKVSSVTSAKVLSTLSTSVKASATSSKASSTGCTSPTAVSVTFEESVSNTTGHNIKIVGSIPSLGSWNTSKAIALADDVSNECDPYWFGKVSLAAGTVVQYKYIDVAKDGSVTWEADPNHTYTVPSGCSATAAPTVSNSWQNWT